jgi:hypothetical protein
MESRKLKVQGSSLYPHPSTAERENVKHDVEFPKLEYKMVYLDSPYVTTHGVNHPFYGVCVIPRRTVFLETLDRSLYVVAEKATSAHAWIQHAWAA